MSIRVALKHRTHYEYDRLVSLAPQVIRLRPAPHCRTPIEAYSLRLNPEKKFLNWIQDPFGNFLARAVFPDQTTKFTVEVDLVADMRVINPFDFFLEDAATDYPFKYEALVADELRPYLEVREKGPALMDWVSKIDRTPRRTVDFLVDVNRKAWKDVGYTIRLEPGVQSAEETLTKGTGSCRDSAWLVVQALRHLGLAARFVSGYIVQLTPDVKSLDGPSGTDKDFVDLHAWAEVFIPGGGWIGLDPTSGLMAGEGHIPLACTPDPSGAAPVTGGVDPCESEFEYEMSVQRLREEPRVTKPFTEEVWSKIEELGRKVDVDLQTNDVRLTMGGEPTFVSIDDMDGDEWNTAAVGPTKRKLGRDLLERLRERLAPRGLLHIGQGKWYPGEPLPRWAFTCYWRKDGHPIWLDPTLTADDRKPGDKKIEDANAFALRLAEKLGVDPGCVEPGYEDVFYYLWKERTYPANVDPLKADLKDGLERRRLAALLDRGLEKVTGFALPLRWQDHAQGGEWMSCKWIFRTGRMYLMPGDSPMGLRLPLDSLLYELPGERHEATEVDPLVRRPPLGPRTSASLRRGQPDAKFPGDHPYARRLDAEKPVQPVASRKPLPPQTTPSAARMGYPGGEYAEEMLPATKSYPYGLVRTAVCIEPREGHVHLFLPPISFLEQYLELIATIEETAGELDIPVVIEGYGPPDDPRLRNVKVTPDPGVIEVNLPPMENWDELHSITEMLYHEARVCRLGTEKFMVDGRHTGTGGGNHVTLGGATPADSPMLRRPDVLASMITYWQHHPSLTYFFSGMFIGPTCQAPRVDEARHEALYELEIAFQQMDKDGGQLPWLVDRHLRNLLTDLTGNTHRAEFCIDKLFSPDSFTGRLGIVELRSLEMPPHYRMSLLQMVLLRALVARFWKRPYQHRLVRWGTALHDKFLLPHFLWEDLREVVADLTDNGYEMEMEWFKASYEFRFPPMGKIHVRDMTVELRTAIEPWNTMGEETSAGGTARYVDSSLERLQVKVFGMTDTRHAIVCNGRRVPLHSTGTPGEFVGGVRYRAWQPPSSLHPTIGVHAPLVVDVVDLWNQRSVGGCTYYVSHPGGMSYSNFPINSYEAEARRISRFLPFGHTPGKIDPPMEELNRDYPYTLDLRRAADLGFPPNCR